MELLSAITMAIFFVLSCAPSAHIMAAGNYPIDVLSLCCIEVKNTPNANCAPPTTPVALLFTSSSPDVAEKMDSGWTSATSTFNPSYITIFINHGWIDGVCRTTWMREMKDELFRRGGYNVILVDWTCFNTREACAAFKNCETVAEFVAGIIQKIRGTVYLIGHSLGAIICGMTGRKLQSGAVEIIFALDPSLNPCETSPPCLSRTDAVTVIVIHCNGCCYTLQSITPVYIAIAIGDPRCMGHADFYPNGGCCQPGCYTYIFLSLYQGNILSSITSAADPRLCSHQFCHELFKRSILDCLYVAKLGDSYENCKSGIPYSNPTCPNSAIMGLNFTRTTTQTTPSSTDTGCCKYYIDTSITPPYCQC